MENVKITYIPQSLVKSNKGLLKSITEIALYDTELINAHIFYNSQLDININTNDSDLINYTDYISQDNLYSSISKTLSLEDYETVLILYGYDLSLDDIKNNICPLVYDCEGVFISINIIDNNKKENTYNMNTYLDSECYEIDDEEWKKIKEELYDIYEESNLEEDEEEDNSSSIITFDNLYDLADKLEELYSPSSNTSKKSTNGDSRNNKNEDIEDKLSEDFVCYSYEDFYNSLSISNNKGLIIIEDEDGNKVLFNLKALGFVIDTLNKFSQK